MKYRNIDGKRLGRRLHNPPIFAYESQQRLLCETDTSVVEAAFACWFANQEHMTRLFKQHSGTTPAAYRKILRT